MSIDDHDKDHVAFVSLPAGLLKLRSIRLEENVAAAAVRLSGA